MRINSFHGDSTLWFTLTRGLLQPLLESATLAITLPHRSDLQPRRYLSAAHSPHRVGATQSL